MSETAYAKQRRDTRTAEAFDDDRPFAAGSRLEVSENRVAGEAALPDLAAAVGQNRSRTTSGRQSCE